MTGTHSCWCEYNVYVHVPIAESCMKVNAAEIGCRFSVSKPAKSGGLDGAGG